MDTRILVRIVFSYPSRPFPHLLQLFHTSFFLELSISVLYSSYPHRALPTAASSQLHIDLPVIQSGVVQLQAFLNTFPRLEFDKRAAFRLSGLLVREEPHGGWWD